MTATSVPELKVPVFGAALRADASNGRLPVPP